MPSGPGHCSAGDPTAGLFSRGRERDLPGSQAIRPMPLPRSRTPAEPTIPRLLTVSSMLPPLFRQRRLQREIYIGATARLQHPLPTLHEWCCHHPCKARFQLAGSPLLGGSRTLRIAMKGFRSFSSSSPGLFLAQRKLDSAILVVKATENWICRDGTEALNRAMERRVLVQGTMCPRLIIVGGICA